jgi:hypothetical protein
MDRVRIVISYNGRWEQLPDGSQRFIGSDNRGMYVSKNMTYDELVAIVHTIVNYDVNRFNVDLSSISIVPGSTCRTLIRNDDDVQFMLGEDRVIPQVCVSLTERTNGDVIGNIPPHENTQQFGSFSGSNQVFTQRSDSERRGSMFGVPPVEVVHANMVGCRVEQYNEQNNEQDNQQFNEQNNEQDNQQFNEQNNEQDNQQYNQQYNHPNHDVEYETNNEQVDDFQNLDEEAEPEEIQRRGRRVHSNRYAWDIRGPV